MHKLYRILLSMISVLLIAFATGSFFQPAIAEDDESFHQYLNWGMRQPSEIEKTPTTLGQILKHSPLPEWARNRPVNLSHRPMLRFRVWADLQPRPLAAFVFLSFAAMTLFYICPRLLADCTNHLSRRFWWSLLGGVITMCIFAVFVRACFVSLIGTPLAFLLVGIFELGMVFGLVSVAALLGDFISKRLKVERFFGAKPAMARLISLVAGCFIIGLMLAIPGPGSLPRIGTRLVFLIGLVGLGAFVATIRQGSLGERS